METTKDDLTPPIATPAPSRELTYGERAVGLTFNPSGKAEVIAIKQKSAALIDELNDQFNTVTDGEVKAQLKIAIRAAQEAQMWGEKAATWL
jgi:hypothetical protein